MSRVPSSSLSATSYAILGLLAIRSWTPYELTRQMQFSLNRFWPRAESKLYEEPKKLVQCGFADAIAEAGGKRTRTRYAITDAGRAALTTWLQTTSRMPVLEAEPLLRVFLAEHGSRDALRSTLAHVRSWAAAKLKDDADTAAEYRAGRGRFPQRTAQVTLVGRFLSDFAWMTYQWSQWAQGTLESWPAEIGNARADEETLQLIVDRAVQVDVAEAKDGGQ